MAKKPRISVTFEDDDLDAVIRGLALLERQEDVYEDDDEDTSPRSATAVLQHIAAVLDDEPSGCAPSPHQNDGPHEAAIREAIHGKRKLRLRYVDKGGSKSLRIIWPLEFGSFGAGDTVAAWCETRRAFRHFRLDRITALERMDERYPGHRRILLARLHVDEMDQGY